MRYFYSLILDGDSYEKAFQDFGIVLIFSILILLLQLRKKCAIILEK